MNQIQITFPDQLPLITKYLKKDSTKSCNETANKDQQQPSPTQTGRAIKIQRKQDFFRMKGNLSKLSTQPIPLKSLKIKNEEIQTLQTNLFESQQINWQFVHVQDINTEYKNEQSFDYERSNTIQQKDKKPQKIKEQEQEKSEVSESLEQSVETMENPIEVLQRLIEARVAQRAERVEQVWKYNHAQIDHINKKSEGFEQKYLQDYTQLMEKQPQQEEQKPQQIENNKRELESIISQNQQLYKDIDDYEQQLQKQYEEMQKNYQKMEKEKIENEAKQKKNLLQQRAKTQQAQKRKKLMENVYVPQSKKIISVSRNKKYIEKSIQKELGLSKKR